MFQDSPSLKAKRHIQIQPTSGKARHQKKEGKENQSRIRKPKRHRQTDPEGLRQSQCNGLRRLRKFTENKLTSNQLCDQELCIDNY